MAGGADCNPVFPPNGFTAVRGVLRSGNPKFRRRMKLPFKLTRRKFLGAALLGVPVSAAADACWLEPEWLQVRTVRIGKEKPSHRLVHFTDLHHKGDRALLARVVAKINSLSPDFVCFTGDLVEEKEFLPEALDLLRGITSPLYGVPGNHDYWSGADFSVIARTFEATGGAWLVDVQTLTRDGRVNLIGATGNHSPRVELRAGARNILLLHYPADVKQLGTQRLDLILAGHSHGGQVRLPFLGPLVLPTRVDEFDLGLFETKSGPLYVGAGIGWFHLNIRFRCRPEITVFEV